MPYPGRSEVCPILAYCQATWFIRCAQCHQGQATSGALAMQQRLSLEVFCARHGSPRPFSCSAKSSSGSGSLPSASSCSPATFGVDAASFTVHLQ